MALRARGTAAQAHQRPAAPSQWPRRRLPERRPQSDTRRCSINNFAGSISSPFPRETHAGSRRPTSEDSKKNNNKTRKEASFQDSSGSSKKPSAARIEHVSFRTRESGVSETAIRCESAKRIRQKHNKFSELQDAKEARSLQPARARTRPHLGTPAQPDTLGGLGLPGGRRAAHHIQRPERLRYKRPAGVVQQQQQQRQP